LYTQKLDLRFPLLSKYPPIIIGFKVNKVYYRNE